MPDETKDAKGPTLAEKIAAVKKGIAQEAGSGGHHVEIARLACDRFLRAEAAQGAAASLEAEGDALMARAVEAKKDHEKLSKEKK